MESIVSPWFIYLLSVVNSIIVVTALIAVFGIIISIIFAIIFGINSGYEEGYKNTLNAWKYMRPKFFITVIVISFVLSIFIPSRDTIIAMYVADKITYNSIETATDFGKNVKETLKKDIIEIIQSINKTEKEK